MDHGEANEDRISPTSSREGECMMWCCICGNHATMRNYVSYLSATVAAVSGAL